MKNVLKKLFLAFKKKLAGKPHPPARFRDGGRRPIVTCPICQNKVSGYDFYVWDDVDRIFVVVCDSCGLIHNTETLDAEFLEGKGKHGGSVVYGKKNTEKLKRKSFDLMKSRGEKYVDYILDYDGSLRGATVLDVTTQYGGIVDAFNQAGFLSKGVDNEEELVSYCVDKGLDVDESEFLDYNPECKFKIISFARVLNHYIDPALYLKKAAELLEDDGLLFIEQLDVIHAIQRKGLERSVSLDHPVMFSKETLFYLLNLTGFEVVDWQSDSMEKNFKSLNHIHLLAKKSTVQANKPSAERMYNKLNAAIAQFSSSSKYDVYK